MAQSLQSDNHVRIRKVDPGIVTRGPYQVIPQKTGESNVELFRKCNRTAAIGQKILFDPQLAFATQCERLNPRT